MVIAVPKNCDAYDHLMGYADRIGLDLFLFKGNPLSPLHRMADVLRHFNFSEDFVVRITHDDILIDQKTMLDLISECNNTPDCGYGISPSIIEGAGVEVIHKANILMAAEKRIEPTEYISYFVKDAPFSKQVIMKPRESICRNYRLTLDFPNDYVVLENVLREVGVNGSLDKIAEFLDHNNFILNLNKLPKISVYTCAFNASEYIEQTMESILSQSPLAEYLEYIFIDDASTDDTLTKAMRFNGDKRIHYYVNEFNKGLASSSNIALPLCHGDYIVRVDADDILLTDSLCSMSDFLINEMCSVVYPAYTEIDEKDNILTSFKKPQENHHAGGALMDRRMINEIRFKDGLKHWDSKDLYLRIKDKFKIGYIQNPLWCYRIHPKSMSQRMTPERLEGLNVIG